MTAAKIPDNPDDWHYVMTVRGPARRRKFLVDPFAKFAARIEPELNSGCWLWNGVPQGAGYGVIYHEGRQQLAHRVAWELFKGPIPDGMCACHRCDTPACCNPDHLFLGTHKDNADDRTRKGRGRWGETSGRAHLKDADVLEIRRVAAGNKESLSAIGARYGVSASSVYGIVSGRTWKHLPLHPGPIPSTPARAPEALTTSPGGGA